MAQLSDIVNGWKAYIVNDPIAKKQAKERAAICAACPHKTQGIIRHIMPDYTLREIQGYTCNHCGCPLSTATRSKSYNCPLNKWKCT